MRPPIWSVESGTCRRNPPGEGVKQLGTRLGNWLSSDQAKRLLENADGEDLRSIRDLAMLAVLLGCGQRRAELSGLKADDR
jgi:site-specific recombinase XerC